MRKSYITLIIGILAILCVCIGASKGSSEYKITPAPDYSQAKMWFTLNQADSKEADVFYVAPTSIWDWKDSIGNIYYHMDTDNIKQRRAVDLANRLAAALFENSCRFYAPYYRQITMNSWMTSPDEAERRYELAHKDVVEAFKYYMKNINNGRPFILAGHSQGAKAIIELLKHTLNENQYKNMVAAYIFGFPISQQELDNFPKLKPAKNSTDCGVIICYNSVSTPDAISPLFNNNTICINPINWQTDTTYASAKENIGSVFFKRNGTADTLFQKVGARIDTLTKAVIIDGLSDDNYYTPSIEELFPKGNYHIQEINLYFLNLQQNIKQRIEAFRSSK